MHHHPQSVPHRFGPHRRRNYQIPRRLLATKYLYLYSERKKNKFNQYVMNEYTDKVS